MLSKSEKLGITLSASFSGRFLPWVTGIMVYIACLILATGLVLHQSGRNWNKQLEGRLSIAFPAGQAGDETISILLDQLRSDAAVISATTLAEDQMRDLIRPWVGEGADVAGLALPLIIDLALRDYTPETVASLERTIRKIAPEARLDSHQEVRVYVKRFTYVLQMMAFLLSFLVLLCNMAMVGIAVSNTLANHQDTVEILHLVGATDKNIVGEFLRSIFWLSIKGSLVALFLVVISLFLFGFFTRHLEWVADFHILWWQWSLILALPGLVVLSALIFARLTVLRNLQKMV